MQLSSNHLYPLVYQLNRNRVIVSSQDSIHDCLMIVLSAPAIQGLGDNWCMESITLPVLKLVSLNKHTYLHKLKLALGQ